MSVVDFSHSSNHSFDEFKKLLTQKMTILSKTITQSIRQLKFIENLLSPEDESSGSIELIKEFKKTIGCSLDELEQYFQQQKHLEEEILLFKGEFLRLIIKILANIIEIQRRIDSLYSDASKKIIDYLGNVLLVLLASLTPTISLIIHTSNILEWIKPYFTLDNLKKVVLSTWEDKSKAIRDKLAEGEKIPTSKKI